MTREDAIAKLNEIGQRRAALVAALSGVDTELERAIAAAHAASVPKLVIAREAGVVRQTVYNVLARERAQA